MFALLTLPMFQAQLSSLIGASSPECPRNHQRELFLPKYTTVRSNSLFHDGVRTCTAQRFRRYPCVIEEERLLCASDKVCARKLTRHKTRRPVTAARRGGEDRNVDMDAEPQERGRALPPPRRLTLRFVQRVAPRQTATSSIAERLRRRTSRVPRTVPAQSPGVLVEPQRLIGQPMYTEEYGGRDCGLLKQP